jgi:FecR protein
VSAQITSRSSRSVSAVLLLALVWLGFCSHAVAQQVVPVRVNRWLEIKQLSGVITCILGGVSQSGRVSARLQNVGDTLITGENSNAVLEVDTEIGFVSVSENTTVRILALNAAPDGSRITRLQVTGGQVRLQIRPFTLPSQLEIETPAGVSGVRGTVFGVSVQPTGTTGVATLEGSVFATAQDQEVAVSEGFQSSIVPGEPPSPPVPLRDDPTFDLRLLRRVDQQLWRIVGQVDPVNLVQLGEETLTIDPSGVIDLQVPQPGDRQILITVTTPLGMRRIYQVRVP